MRSIQRLMIPLIALIAACLVPASSMANTINLHDQPMDQSKITGTVDLSTGIIPIYTPKDSQWTKVADPRNGNTGWIKNSELKDSKGNIITFSQNVTDNGGKSVTMTYGNMTPEQKKTLETQMQQQQKDTQEYLLKIQQGSNQVMDGLKKIYQQQMELMQKNGFPVVLPAINPPTLPPAQPATTPAKPMSSK